MAWIRPIDFEAGLWQDEYRAYDGKVGAGYYTYENGLDETHQLRLWLPGLMLVSKIRFYAECEKSNPQIAFTGFDPEAPPDGDWIALVPAYIDFTNLTWTEVSIEPRSITGIGVLLKHIGIGYQRLHEIEVWVEASTPGYNNCIALYKMNDNAANPTVVDAMGNHNGTFKDAGGDPNTDAHYTEGKINGALEFDGTDDYVEVANHADFNFTLRPFSISMWLKCDNIGFRGFMSKFDNAGNDEFVIQTDPTSKLHFRCYDDSSGGFIGRTYDTALSTDVWFHLVVTYDGGLLSSGMKIYIDVQRVDDGDSKGGTFAGIEALNAPVNIGEYFGYEHDGLVDAVMFFDKVLSQEEIVWLWNEGDGIERLGPYHNVYRGQDGDIDYENSVAIMDIEDSQVSIADQELPPNTIWEYIRRQVSECGLESEDSPACKVAIDSAGDILGDTPNPPLDLTIQGLSNGRFRLRWHYTPIAEEITPTGFNIYMDSGSGFDFETPTATVSYGLGGRGEFEWISDPLTDGELYRFCVRSYQSGPPITESQNTDFVADVADSVGPDAITGLRASWKEI